MTIIKIGGDKEAQKRADNSVIERLIASTGITDKVVVMFEPDNNHPQPNTKPEGPPPKKKIRLCKI